VSSVGDPKGHDHVGDEYINYNRCREMRPRPYLPPFPPSSEEEEEAHREEERRAERDVEHEVERRLGDTYDLPEGSGKVPMDLDAAFM
jgi:hypothetical protein